MIFQQELLLRLDNRGLVLRFRLYDRLILGFLIAFPILIALSGKVELVWPTTVTTHVVMILAALGLILAEDALPGPLRFLRDWYPMVYFTLFFGEVGRAVNAFFPFWLEPAFLESDRWLFATEGWRYISPKLGLPATELFAFAYWSYYPLLPFAVWLPYRRELRMKPLAPAQSSLFEHVMARIALALISCYVCFLLMPARGPHHALQLSHAKLFQGGPFLQMVLVIQKHGSVVGAAFPSSHVAAAWVAVLALRRVFPRTFWALTPLLVLLTASTFILQYHYVVDAVGGILLALLVELLAPLPALEARGEARKLPARRRLRRLFAVR